MLFTASTRDNPRDGNTLTYQTAQNVSQMLNKGHRITAVVFSFQKLSGHQAQRCHAGVTLCRWTIRQNNGTQNLVFIISDYLKAAEI